jgi:small GTP-binding protein
VNYEPKIGVFGKTGAGKSSLCNALFGSDICEISDIKACTRNIQEVFLSIGKKGLKLLDCPGVGESGDRDKEYAKLYQNLLPELDLIIWVLKGDDRAFTSDQAFYKQLVQPYMKSGKSFFMVINQVDKIEPFREWDVDNRRPGVKQAHNIDEKRHAVAGFFDLPLSKIVAVSANEKFGLIELVDSIISSLPDEKKAVVLRQVEKEIRPKKAKEEAEEGFVNTIIDVGVDFLQIPKTAKKAVKKLLKKVANFLNPFNWFS